MTACDITLMSWGVGPKSKLTLDGEDISPHVKGLHLWVDPDTREYHLDLRVVPIPHVELRDVHTQVDAETHDLLVRLGWTPPAEEQEATG